jgi:hypothetical protein
MERNELKVEYADHTRECMVCGEQIHCGIICARCAQGLIADEYAIRARVQVM